MAAEAARRAHDELDRADAEIRDLDGRIAAAEETLRPAHEDLGCAKAAEVAQRTRFDAALSALRELTARHREAGTCAERYALVEQVERQRVERAGLASRCDLIVEHRRKADEIRADFDRSYAGEGDRPPSLVTFHGGSSWGELAGQARVEPALDAPRLVTDADVRARAEKFARFRGLAEAAGDVTRGQGLFATKCLTCHHQGGQGGKIGPALDGLGLTGVEAILRHVLTPSAAMEGGYRSFRVVTRDGRVIQGLLVSSDADAIVIRQPDVADIRIAAKDVAQADFTGISVMPEGLLEALQPQDVSDLFAHLKSLTVKTP